MDDLTNQWRAAKNAVKSEAISIENIITEARKKKKSVRGFHYGNIVILAITLIVISLFFIYVANFQELVSRIGVAFMTGGLAVRILIECFSTVKSQRIKLLDKTAKTTDDALQYYAYRKKIHGPVTITIVALYTLGFYMLTPEFSLYIAIEWMVLMHVSYIVGAVFLVWQIKKGIRKEMQSLVELVALKKEMNNG